MRSKHNGAMERLDQIATATKNEELKKNLASIKTKEAEHKKLVVPE
ncbi:MAG: hypothetical protein GY822_23360 [Deltaproteobacteria bacterium]|nr:hypothetical protein [Deltaproteobacteria bacterium]